MQRTLAQAIAVRLLAMENCRKSGNDEWLANHRDSIEELTREHLPSGSGIDNGAQFDFDASRPERLVFSTSFHHMNEAGFYDGWTEHNVIVRPSLAYGLDIRVTGRNRNDVKDYLGDVFHGALKRMVD